MRSLRLALPLVGIAAHLAGCTRDLSFPEPAPPTAVAKLPDSVACTGAEQCGSGQCIDGVCCDRACGSSERCNLPGTTGRCTSRPSGSTCATAQECPTGFCVEGVCCSSACDGACRSCRLPGQVGTCGIAIDGTRPPPTAEATGKCSGTCNACFGGACGLVPPESDPAADCTGGSLCDGSGHCAVPPTLNCGAAPECIYGQCTLGHCGGFELVEFTHELLAPEVLFRNVEAIASNPAGDQAFLLTEVSQGDTRLVQRLLLFHRAAGTPWRGLTVAFGQVDTAQPSAGSFGGALTWQGRELHLLWYRYVFPCDQTSGPHACGVHAGKLIVGGGAITDEGVIATDPAGSMFFPRLGLSTVSGELVAASFWENGAAVVRGKDGRWEQPVLLQPIDGAWNPEIRDQADLVPPSVAAEGDPVALIAGSNSRTSFVEVIHLLDGRRSRVELPGPARNSLMGPKSTTGGYPTFHLVYTADDQPPVVLSTTLRSDGTFEEVRQEPGSDGLDAIGLVRAGHPGLAEFSYSGFPVATLKYELRSLPANGVPVARGGNVGNRTQAVRMVGFMGANWQSDELFGLGVATTETDLQASSAFRDRAKRLFILRSTR